MFDKSTLKKKNCIFWPKLPIFLLCSCMEIGQYLKIVSIWERERERERVNASTTNGMEERDPITIKKEL